MTPQEAVEILKGAIKKPNTKDGYLGQALDMAIKALEQQPCEYKPFTIDELENEDMQKLLREFQNQKTLVAEHDCLPSVTIIEPSEDCISRAEALKHSHIEYDDDGEGHRVIYAEDIEDLPSATPQQKIGHWIGGSICNRCNYKKMLLWRYNYCPNCGVKMETESEE